MSGPAAFAIASRLSFRTRPARSAVDSAPAPSCSTRPAPAARAELWCFAGPRSYTGEDVVEIHVAGRSEAPRPRAAQARRARRAARRPGEFTRRALLNGRIDLTRAEAVAALDPRARRGRAQEGPRPPRRRPRARGRVVRGPRRSRCSSRSSSQLDFSDQDVTIVDETGAGRQDPRARRRSSPAACGGSRTGGAQAAAARRAPRPGERGKEQPLQRAARPRGRDRDAACAGRRATCCARSGATGTHARCSSTRRATTSTRRRSTTSRRGARARAARGRPRARGARRALGRMAARRSEGAVRVATMSDLAAPERRRAADVDRRVERRRAPASTRCATGSQPRSRADRRTRAEPFARHGAPRGAPRARARCARARGTRDRVRSARARGERSARGARRAARDPRSRRKRSGARPDLPRFLHREMTGDRRAKTTKSENPDARTLDHPRCWVYEMRRPNMKGGSESARGPG